MAQNRNGGSAESIREGGRWLNAAPPSAEVADWFKDNVKLHEGLTHDEFIGGVVLIKSAEKISRNPDKFRDVFTPYAKVDTRIDYFWKWCALHEYLGVIEKVPHTFSDERWRVLPTGFFPAAYLGADGKFRYNLGCEIRVGVFEKDLRSGGRGRPVIEPATAVKVVAWGSEPDTFLKCETGAVGRSLGMAGMLVVGSGVATAEDITELAGHEEAELPAAAPLADDADSVQPTVERTLADEWAELQQRIESDFPGLADDLESWAQERQIDVTSVKETQLRAVVKQAQKLIDGAEKQAASRS